MSGLGNAAVDGGGSAGGTPALRSAAGAVTSCDKGNGAVKAAGRALLRMRPFRTLPMRRIFRRSMLWLLPVVLLPIGALAVTQYRLLRALEQKSASAERNWLRNSLELASSEIEWSYRRAATT